ncbi:hypothetical protein ACQY0O_005317 [Thecaphora frezii]
MDYRDPYRRYDRPSGFEEAAPAYKHPMEDAFDRSRKRGRSPSPAFDRYAPERHASAYGSYPPPVDAWEGDLPPPERSPYAGARGGPYDDYPREADLYERERERALEWERYYRERDPGYADDYGLSDRERYEARRRYDDDDLRARDDRRYRERERSNLAYGSADTPQRRPGPDYARDGASYRASGGEPAVPPDPLSMDVLLNFRTFAQMTKAAHPSARDRNVSLPTTQELYEGYQAYRSAFAKKAMQAFFEQRKDDVWFKEKYSAAEEYASARQKRRRAGRAGRKEAWLDELASGKLDGVSFDLRSADSSSSASGAPAVTSKDDDEDESRVADAHDEADPERDEHPHRRHSESVRQGENVLTSRYGEPEAISGEQVAIPVTEYQILVKSFPPDISRAKLEQHLQSRPGFRYLALGEPHSGRKWHRVGWAVYEEGTDMEETVRALDGKEIEGFTFHLSLSRKPSNGKLRIMPEYANSFVRLIQDLRQVKALVAKLEDEDRTSLFTAEAEANAAWLLTNASDAILARHREVDPEFREEMLEQGFDADEEADKREARRERIKKHLDWHLDLLRTVYHSDYYLSLVCEFQEELLRRSPRYARRRPPPSMLYEEPKEGSNDESWAKSVDNKTALLLCNDKADLTEYGGKSIDAELMSAALPFVKEEEKEKHRCIVEVAGAQCGKLFKAAIFVQKHVLNKHRAFLDGQAGDSISEARYFNNFVRDPCRPQNPAGLPIAGAANGPGSHAGTPLAHRFGGVAGGIESPLVPSPLFNGSRVGLIRLGGSTAVTESPAVGSYGRRAPSPGRRLGDRMGMAPPPTAAVPMVMGFGSPPAGAGPALSMRIGGMAPVNGGGGGSGVGGIGMGGGGLARDPTPKLPAEPLPEPPKPLDPRAARTAQRSYTDLDGPAAQGDVDDLAY